MEFLYVHKNGIALRKVAVEDLELLLDLKTESWFGTHQIAFLNYADQLDWFESIRKNPNALYLTAYDTSKDNAKVGLYTVQHIDWINRVAQDGHHVFKEHRGKGYSFPVKEAGVDFVFEMLNTNRIEGQVIVNNLASMGPAERVGFQREGTLRQAVYRSGRYLDSWIIGLLREDWERLPRVLAFGGICNTSYTPKDGTRRDAVVTPSEDAAWIDARSGGHLS